MPNIDLAGNTLITQDIRIGATQPGDLGTSLSSTELVVLDGVTAGTVSASKAVVVDSSSNLTALNNLSMTGDLTVDGAAGTGATSAAVVKMTTPETTVVITDQLGRIDFSAPLEASGSDAILTSASIWAEAGATFDATTNDTDLVFALGLSEAAAEKARLDSSGNFTSLGGVTSKSTTAVPATASAVTTGAPITCFSSGWKLWVTSDAPTHSATKGDLCINTAGSSSSTRLFINNGTTTWIAVTTAT